jgi:hypothetical protein
MLRPGGIGAHQTEYPTGLVRVADRFSRNDVTPSTASALRPRACTKRLSTRWASMGWLNPRPRHIICRVSAMDTGAVFAMISRAMAPAAGNNSSSG